MRRCFIEVDFTCGVVYEIVIFLSCSDNISSIYTSGRKCNFQNKGCDAQHLQPVNINGWFWADGNKRIPPTNIPSRLTFWSRSGEQRKPQPDNYAGLKAGKLGKGLGVLTFLWDGSKSILWGKI